MAVLVVAQLHVHDPAGYQAYIDRVPATIAAHGGRYRARSPAPTVLDGASEANRLVVVEFPSRKHAETWFASAEYQAIAPIRQRCARGSLTLVDALP